MHFIADRPHDICLHNNGEEVQAPAVPHVVRRGMKQGVIGSQWSDKHKVLAVAIAPKEPIREWPGIHPLNTLQGLVPYSHTAKQADLPHAFMLLLGFHMGAEGIHLALVIIAMSIECKHQVCVIGLLTSCMVKSASGGSKLLFSHLSNSLNVKPSAPIVPSNWTDRSMVALNRKHVVLWSI